jgi:uncharacterized protein (UPF0305 family)
MPKATETKINPEEPPATQDDEIRIAENKKKESIAMADSYDKEQAELMKMIKSQEIQKENANETLDEQINDAYRLLRQFQRTMVVELVYGKKYAEIKAKFLAQLEKLPEIPEKKEARDALKTWYAAIDEFAKRYDPEKTPEMYDMVIECRRLITKQKERILALRKEQIAHGVTLKEIFV